MNQAREKHHEVVVVGAGVSGLALAHDLHSAGTDVVVVEKEKTPGGCAQTVFQDGFLFEKGPFNLLVRNPLFEDLLQSLGDNLEVVPPSPSAKHREIILHGARQKVPASLGEAVTTPLLSTKEKIRLLAEPFVGSRPTSADPTLGDIVRRRFGDAVADRIVSAVVAGVFGGDSDVLSAKACFPILWETDQKSRSLILGFIRRGFQSRGKPKRRWKGMVSFQGGVGGFCQAMASSLGDRFLAGCRVTSIVQKMAGYRIEASDEERGALSLTAGKLVLATDLPAAREILRPMAPDAAEALDPIESVSLAVVNLGYGPEAFETPPQGFGFLVPKPEKKIQILGALWASSVFPHQAPPGCHAIRIFVGGVRSPGWVHLPDGELIEKAIGELSGLIEIKEQPRSVFVSRWPNSVPQMVPGHCERIQSLETVLEKYPGLTLVGNYLRGISVNDCVVNARLATKAIIR